MTSSPQLQNIARASRHSRGLSGVLVALHAALAAGLAGCASPGIPRPPSLHLPATVTDLSASRIGNRVELRWTAPTRTTDGLDLIDPKPVATTTEICRDLPVTRASVTPPPPGPPCTPALSVAGHSGASMAIDTLPASLTASSAAGTSVAYRVRVLNGSGRSAAPSARVLVPVGPPVEEVAGFRATQARNGVVLEWNRAGEGKVEVLRTLVVPAQAGDAAPAKPGPQKGAFHGRHTEPAATVILHVDPQAAGPNSNPPGKVGMLDASALPEASYLYRAERIRPVLLGGGSVIVRSEPTPPIQIAMRDTFPPQPPTGLASLPGTLRNGPTATPAPTIDLSWQPNTEPDLAGYLVYRTDLGPATSSAEPRRLTPTPIPGPAYRDAEVIAGERYQYRVTAVDQRGNESKPGAPVTDSPVKPF